jgi:hypothetical protein
VHPNAALSAEAAEAADRQGAFWPMHDLLLQHQQELRPVHLVRYAADLGIDIDRFREDLRRHIGAARVAEDVDSAAPAEWRAHPRSSSTAAGNTAPTTSTPARSGQDGKAQVKLDVPDSSRPGRRQTG